MEESIRAMEDSLRRFHAGVAANSVEENPNRAALIPPKGMEMHMYDNTVINQRILRYRQEVPDLPEIPTEFSELPDISAGLTISSVDFRDDRFIHEPALALKKYEDPKIVNMGRSVMPMLYTGFSQQGVGALFILAYQLRDPSDISKAFLPDIDTVQLEDSTLSDLPATVLTSLGEPTPLPPTHNIQHEAAAYAFIAASTLRMFTKSEENYVKAFNHILLGFQRFYGFPIPINMIVPTVEALKTLTHYFAHNRRMRMTLYRLLYASGGTKDAQNLRTFLYEMHITNTGIHIISIFVRLCGVLNCTPGLLLSVINAKEFERQIGALVTMIKLIMKSEPEYSRKMWKYGRLFDETFMSALQTKACPKLTYILASALKSESSKTNADILKIAQLGDVSLEQRILCDEVGLMIVKMIRKLSTKYRI